MHWLLVTNVQQLTTINHKKMFDENKIFSNAYIIKFG